MFWPSDSMRSPRTRPFCRLRWASQLWREARSHFVAPATGLGRRSAVQILHRSTRHCNFRHCLFLMRLHHRPPRPPPHLPPRPACRNRWSRTPRLPNRLRPNFRLVNLAGSLVFLPKIPCNLVLNDQLSNTTNILESLFRPCPCLCYSCRRCCHLCRPCPCPCSSCRLFPTNLAPSLHPSSGRGASWRRECPLPCPSCRGPLRAGVR